MNTDRLRFSPIKLVNTRRIVVPDLDRTAEWRREDSIFHAHPTNHRMVPGGQDYEERYAWVRDQIAPGSLVLDVGCNCGQLAVNLTKDLQCRVWGMDIVADFVRHCNTEKPQFINAWCADFSRLTSEQRQVLGMGLGAFDVVTALEVIEHPIHVRGFIQNARLALRKGGRLVITTPHPASPLHGYEYMSHTPSHVRMWSKLRLEMAFGPMTDYQEITTGGVLTHIGAVWQW